MLTNIKEHPFNINEHLTRVEIHSVFSSLDLNHWNELLWPKWVMVSVTFMNGICFYFLDESKAREKNGDQEKLCFFWSFQVSLLPICIQQPSPPGLESLWNLVVIFLFYKSAYIPKTYALIRKDNSFTFYNLSSLSLVMPI